MTVCIRTELSTSHRLTQYRLPLSLALPCVCALTSQVTTTCVNDHHHQHLPPGPPAPSLKAGGAPKGESEVQSAMSGTSTHPPTAGPIQGQITSSKATRVPDPGSGVWLIIFLSNRKACLCIRRAVRNGLREREKRKKKKKEKKKEEESVRGLDPLDRSMMRSSVRRVSATKNK